MSLAALVLLAAAQAPCPGDTTPEVNACISEELEWASREEARYADAARKRIAEMAAADPMTKDARSGFDQAEQSFAAYRDAACGAVYDFWAGGTIRTAASLSCRLELTRGHTHDLWRQWLTSPGNTPPTLPEPPVS